MPSSLLIDQIVSADMPMTDYMGGGGDGARLTGIGLLMQTVTPGAGNLLITVQYFDGNVNQQLNAAMALTAGNSISTTWPDLYQDLSGPVSIQFTYLGGIVSGTCLVRIPST